MIDMGWMYIHKRDNELIRTMLRGIIEAEPENEDLMRHAESLDKRLEEELEYQQGILEENGVDHD